MCKIFEIEKKSCMFGLILQVMYVGWETLAYAAYGTLAEIYVSVDFKHFLSKIFNDLIEYVSLGPFEVCIYIMQSV